MIESELQSIKIFLANFTLKIGQEKHLLSILCWKLIIECIKLRISMEKKIGKPLWKKFVVE